MLNQFQGSALPAVPPTNSVKLGISSAKQAGRPAGLAPSENGRHRLTKLYTALRAPDYIY